MKVLFITDYLTPSPNGIAVYCENTIRCLKKMGCQVTTFGPKGCLSADYTLPTIHIDKGSTATFCFPNWKLLKELLFHPYDVIHINCPQVLSGFLLCLVAKWRKIKVIYYNHGNVAIYCQFNFKWKWHGEIATRFSGFLYYFPQRFFDPLILQNPGSSDLHKLFKKRCRTREGFYGTNLELFRFSPTYEKFHLISIGRLSREKNWRRLLSLFAHLPRHYRLTILGGGNLTDELRQQCRELSLDNVVFTGFVSQEEVSSWLQRAQGYITASLFETWGLTLAEALACGTPVIYPNHSPFPELYGRTFPEGLYEIEDANSFVQAVYQTERSSPELREKCRAFAMQYTWEGATEALIEAYRAY